MNFTHFEKNKSILKFDGIVSKIYHRQFDSKTYEYVVLPDVARVIAVTENKKIILIKEKVFSFNKSYFSLPGGAIEENELSKLAALRELEEETGFTSNDIELWFSSNYSQTIISKKYFFIARNCKKNGLINLEPNEKIEVEELSYGDFLDCVTQDEFKNTEIQNKFLKIKLNKKEEENFRKLLQI